MYSINYYDCTHNIMKINQYIVVYKNLVHNNMCSDPKKLDFLFRVTKTGCSEFFMLQ